MGLGSKQVSGDGLDWSQIGGGGLEIPAPTGQARNQLQQQRQPPLRCPRCDSNNTKFCYYNNYSRSQPRHYCRACRRHWTEGGTLRNVPVGGGRKNKRPKTAANSNCDSVGSMSSTSTVHQVAAPFSNGDLESSIFPEIFRQVLFYPPPLASDQGGNGNFAGSLLPHAPPLLPGFAGTPPVTVASNDQGIVIDPLPISTSSSPYSNHATQDSVPGDTLLNLMPGSNMSAWLQDPPPLPASYYWSWWDDTVDFVASGLDHPATANGLQ